MAAPVNAPPKTSSISMCWNPSMDAREEELTARALLADPDQVDVYLRQKRWSELAALVRFAHRDVPVELAQTDAALYRQLREQITRFFLRGGDVFSLKRLETLAAQ
jgi:hypothetical protein